MSSGYFWDAWVPHFVEIKKKAIYAFQSDDSATPDQLIELSTIQSVEASPDDPQVFILTRNNDDEASQFRVSNPTERDVWIRAFLRAKEQASEVAPTEQKESVQVLSVVDLEEAEAAKEEAGGGREVETSLPRPEGYLTTLEHGYFFNTWSKSYWKVEDDLILRKYPSESADKPLEEIHLEKVIASHPTENEDDCTFHIATATRSWVIKCDSKDEVIDWTQALEEIRRHLRSKKTDGEAVDIGGGLVQHFVEVKIGLFARKRRLWVVAAGNDILCYNNAGDYKPQHVYPCKNIAAFDAPVETSHNKEFNLRMKDSTRSYFVCEAHEDREDYHAWYKEVSVAQDSMKDISQELGIDSTEVESLNLKQQDLDGRMRGVLDLIEIRNGNQPVFIRIYGRLRTRGKIVEADISHMQSGGCYVLDLGPVIFEWYGSKSNRFQRNKSLDIASRVRMKERGGNAKIIRLLEGKDDDDARFWSVLGGKKPMPETFILGEEEDKIKNLRRVYRVFKGKINKVFEGTVPSCKILQSNAVFVVESDYEFWTWVGRSASAPDRKLSYFLVEKLQSKVTGWLCWGRVAEEGETVMFKENFSDFPGQLMITAKPMTGGGNVSAKKEQQMIDVKKMLTLEPRPRDYTIIYDDGTGVSTIWKIEGFDKVPFPTKYTGHQWTTDSYLMLYEYKVNTSDRALLYFWQGRDCSINEKGTSAYLTKEASDLMRGKGESKQIRVTQANERDHWFVIFKVYVVHMGKFEDGWENVNKPRLFEVMQSTDGHVRAIEVDSVSSRLHSQRTFVLYTPNTIYVWYGISRTMDEQEKAVAIAENMRDLTGKPEIIHLKEGEESELFWTLLGGKKPYFNKSVEFRTKPRLFEFSNATGVVDVEEELDWNQDALDSNKVMVVDTGSKLWVWFGQHCKVIEEKLSLETCMNYAQANSKLGAECPIIQTRAWQEPLEFTSLFQAWNLHKYPRSLPKSLPLIERNGREVYQEYIRTVYSIEELSSKTLPKGVDPTNKEKYLSDEDFESLFGMSKEEYEKRPAWKRETIKKQAGLY
eukprot:TRINITY_DN5750_c0_g1_i2.p1 TRINITY_DN5750_c0_g1~~TRINITY_DN5750_c0_g1_i2.p1  ORF type:complete len:1043 (+),score=243.74 TRINITY_DN5750_c0_g1_i2:209-3337(+)